MICLKVKKRKVAFLLLCTLLIVGTTFTYKFMYGKPFTLNQLFTRTFIKVMKEDPEVLSHLGILDGSIFDFYNDDLTNNDPHQQKKTTEIYKNDLKVLVSYKMEGMSDEDKLSYEIFQWFLQNEVDGERFMYHNYPVNQYEGVQNQLPEFLISTHVVQDRRSAENYIKRLSKVDFKFEGLKEGLKIREELGIIPPKFALEKVLKEMKEFISHEPKNNVLETSFAEKLDRVEKLSMEEKDSLCKQAEYQIAASVYPAYEKLIAYLGTLEEKAGTDAGVWKLPDGDAYYAYKLKSYTTTNLTAEEIHQIGLNEVARIENEMKMIVDELGYQDISPGMFMKNLSKDNRFKYSNTEEGRLEVINDYENAIREIENSVASCFDIKPKGNVEVRTVPEFKEESSFQAYLIPTSADGLRPSILYINLGSMEELVKYNVKSLAAHEAIPGHHIQRGIQRQLKNVPAFRKAVPFTAFAEGWAMYAEQLSWEESIEKNAFDNLGRLQTELWRAVRLVVDTGIHHKRWTREQAIDYMVRTTGMPENSVETEVERYIVDPGQACAYKIGMLKFLELREKSKNELGEKFDIKEFHNVVLKNGAMPLELLEKQVDQYIENKHSNNAGTH